MLALLSEFVRNAQGLSRAEPSASARQCWDRAGIFGARKRGWRAWVLLLLAGDTGLATWNPCSAQHATYAVAQDSPCSTAWRSLAVSLQLLRDPESHSQHSSACRL